MEKERKQSLFYGMGEELVLCPICEGKKAIKKEHYSDRSLAKLPCPCCNGTGKITEHKRRKL